MQVGIGAEGPIRGRRVAVTGLGAVTCCGVGVDALWDGLLRPKVVGGAVRDYEPADWFGPKEVRQLDRFAQLSMVAADQAVSAAGDLAVDPARRAWSSPRAWADSRHWPRRSASTTRREPTASLRGSCR